MDIERSNERAQTPRGDEISVLGLVNGLLRERRLIIGVAIVCVVAAGVLSLTAHRTYSSTAAFIPQSRRGASPLSGLAAQFGIAIPTGDASQSPTFYADLLKTHQLLDRAVQSRYRIRGPAGVREATLVDILEVPPDDSLKRRAAAAMRLAASIDPTVSQKTGIVELRCTSVQPELSRQICDRMLTLINEYNTETRQSQASAERVFAERRLNEVKQQLRNAEDRLQYFLLSNREYRNSPALAFQAQRLEREISTLQTVYSSVAQAYEQAKIEEVRDTPVLTIVDPPTVPVRPNGRGTVKRAALFLFFGLLITFMIAIARSGLDANSPEREREEFRHLWRMTRGELLRPWRLLRRGSAERSPLRQSA